MMGPCVYFFLTPAQLKCRDTVTKDELHFSIQASEHPTRYAEAGCPS